MNDVRRSIAALILFFFISVNFSYTFAAGCNFSGDDAPDPSSIACILTNIINVALGMAGAVFVFMVAYGAIKLAMAGGDPKGYAGAVTTWQYALIGAFAVVAVFGILAMLSEVLGIEALNPFNLSGMLQGAVNALFNSLNQGASGNTGINNGGNNGGCAPHTPC